MIPLIIQDSPKLCLKGPACPTSWVSCGGDTLLEKGGFGGWSQNRGFEMR